MPSSAIQTAESLIQDWYRRLPELVGNAEPRHDVRIVPALDSTEAEDFVVGYQENLFSIDKFGYAQSELLPPPAKSKGRRKLFQLFWHRKPDQRILLREGICQFAAASALVYRYGWPRDLVRLEPNTKDLGDNAYSVDLVVWDKHRKRPIYFRGGQARPSITTKAHRRIPCVQQ